MRKPAKTTPVAVWPDGTTSHVTRRGGFWMLWLPNGQQHGSSDMLGVKDNVAAHGGTLERRPNPHYAHQLREYENAQLRRMFAPYFRF